MRTSARGIQLIKDFEGLRLTAYRCPAGIWTIGYGHTGDVRQGQTVTEHQAEVILTEIDLPRFEEAVSGLGTLTQNQFDALVSFAYNVGVRALNRSTLARHIRARNYQQAADEFSKWVRAGGKVLPGLVRRRAAERKLFLEPPQSS